MKTAWSGDAFEMQRSKTEITLSITANPLRPYQALQLASALIEAGQAAAAETPCLSEYEAKTVSSIALGAAVSSRSPKNGSIRPFIRKLNGNGTASSPGAPTIANASA